MITQQDIDRILDGNGNVVDQDGNKIGSAGQVYVDDHTGEPSWVTVRTGFFGTSESFAPLQGASLDGEDVRVPYTRDQVKDAPKVDPDQNLSEGEEEELYRHYSLTSQRSRYDPAEHGTFAGATTGSDDMGSSEPGIADAGDRGPADRDPHSADGETGRARLRRYTVTENAVNRDAARNAPAVSSEARTEEIQTEGTDDARKEL